jgi:hypothetical protein
VTPAGGFFYSSHLVIRLEMPTDAVFALVSKFDQAEPRQQSLLAHELHHFHQTLGSSFGVLVFQQRYYQAVQAVMLALIVQRERGSIPKPLGQWMQKNGDRVTDGRARDCHERWTITERLFEGLASPGATVGDAWLAMLANQPTAVRTVAGRSTLGALDAEEILDPEARRQWIHGVINDAERSEPLMALYEQLLRPLHPDTAEVADLPLNPTVDGLTIRWVDLLEGAAKLAEIKWLIRADIDVRNDGWWYANSPYTRALRVMQKIIWAEAKEAPIHDSDWFELPALIDLALSPPSSDWDGVPDAAFCPAGMLDVLPGWRFVRACEVAKHLDRPVWTDLEKQTEGFRTYIGAICDRLGWRTPWDNAAAEREPHTTSPALLQMARALRARMPDLFAYYPLHPQASELFEVLGSPAIAASDSTFHFTMYSRNEANRERQREGLAEMNGFLGFCSYADQLMVEAGPFRPDPYGEGYESPTSDGAITRQLWEMYLPGGAEIELQ